MPNASPIECRRQATPSFNVVKLGGTSVACPIGWTRLVEELQRTPSGIHTVLVCSAVGGVTNLLEQIAMSGGSWSGYASLLGDIRQRHEQLLRELSSPELIDKLEPLFEGLEAWVRARPEPGPDDIPWRARLLAYGELLSSTLAAAYLESAGLGPVWLDARRIIRGGRDAQSTRSQRYLSATCAANSNPQLQRSLGRIPSRLSVTQGFIASNLVGETVLLGRGGSDTSAAVLASMLDAQKLEIRTDVPGFFSADPRRVAGAKMIPLLSYDEATVLGALGAKILHPRSLRHVRDGSIPVEVKWSRDPSIDGTFIADRPEHRSVGIKAVVSRHPLTMYSMRRPRSWQPVGFMSDVSHAFRTSGFSMDLLSSSSSEIRATVDMAAAPASEEAFMQLESDLEKACEVEKHSGLSCVSLVGTRVSRDLGRLGSMLEQFGTGRFHLTSHAADDTHLSFIVDADREEALVRQLHDTLFQSDENRRRTRATSISRVSSQVHSKEPATAL